MAKKKKERGFSFPVSSLAGSSLPNFIRLRKDYGIDVRFMGRFLASIGLSAFLEPFRLWEEIRWSKEIKKAELKKPPIFIIGFWRSGTTLLHDLLCQSEDASYVTTFQTVFPHLVLSHAGWIKPIARQLMPSRRPFDNVDMDLDYPQEEEIAMANIQQISFYNFFYFPNHYPKFYQRDLFFDQADAKQIKVWKSEYKKLISKALLNHKGQRFISKNPSNMARIEVLLEMFPDARFIFIYRNPYKVVESFYRFFTKVIPAIQLQGHSDEVSHAMVAKLYADMVKRYYATRELIPEGHLVEVRYEELIQDPVGEVSKIYRQFGMENLEKDIPHFEKYLEKARDIPKNNYDVSDRTIELVNIHFIDFLTRWKYEVKD